MWAVLLTVVWAGHGVRLGPSPASVHPPVQLPSSGASAPGQLFCLFLRGRGRWGRWSGGGGAAGEGTGQAHWHLEGLHAPVQA